MEKRREKMGRDEEGSLGRMFRKLFSKCLSIELEAGEYQSAKNIISSVVGECVGYHS